MGFAFNHTKAQRHEERGAMSVEAKSLSVRLGVLGGLV
jgi:hypothetical protein